MPESDRLLITRPQHDEMTYYLHEWSKDLISYAEKDNFAVTDLNLKDANKENFESYLQSVDPKILVLNGHGNAKTVGGHENEELLQEDENHELTGDKKLYVRTCESGKLLGKACVEDGAEGFIGYEGKFMLALDTRSNANPREDNLASPIMEASNEAAKAIIDGNNVKRAYKRSQEAYEEKIEKAMANYTLGNNQVLAALVTNKKNQIAHQ
jgi:hypothetical protein